MLNLMNGKWLMLHMDIHRNSDERMNGLTSQAKCNQTALGVNASMNELWVSEWRLKHEWSNFMDTNGQMDT